MRSPIRYPFHRINKPLVILTLAALYIAALSGEIYAAETTMSATNIKPGFNCAKGHSKNEKMICSDTGLAQIDYNLMQLYAQAKLLTHNSTSFRKTNNREWLWREKNCSTRDCLLKWYAHRQKQLAQVIGSHKIPIQIPEHAETTAPSLPPAIIQSEPSPVSTHKLQPTKVSSQKPDVTTLIHEPLLWIMGIGVVILAFFVRIMLATNEPSRKRARIISAAVRNNMTELAAIQMELVADESSGAHDTKKWDKEKRRFIEEAIKPALINCAPLSATETDRLSLILDYLVRDEQRKKCHYKFRGNLDDSANGEYLHFCVQVLKDYGWKVRSARSGKSDAHLVADKNGLIIVAKCKSQSIPVGSDIIHEARSLRQQHKARKAVIISNAPFATVAQKDASASGTLLVHHCDLPLLSRMAAL